MSTLSPRLKKQAGKNVPILCLDTCAILDILRDPIRKNVRVHNQDAYLSLLRKAKSGTHLITLISDRVRTEFCDNIQEVQCETERSLTRFYENINKLGDLYNLHGLREITNSRHWTSYVKSYLEQCHSAAEDWIKSGIEVSESCEIITRAYQRAVQERTPARKGQSVKDCAILETYYYYLRNLRAYGLNTPAVFVSSNTRDYAEPRGGKIRDDIESEFKSLGLEYAPNMAAAKYYLGF